MACGRSAQSGPEQSLLRLQIRLHANENKLGKHTTEMPTLTNGFGMHLCRALSSDRDVDGDVDVDMDVAAAGAVTPEPAFTSPALSSSETNG